MKNIILILVVILSFACNGSKKTARTEKTTESAQKEGELRFIVSFFSPGNGVDFKIIDEYTAYLKANYSTVVYEKIAWGREGEFDLCFKLTELKGSKQETFVKESKELLSKSRRVHTYENSAYKHLKK